MKAFFTFLFIFILANSWSQQITYYDHCMSKTTNAEDYENHDVIFKNPIDTNIATVLRYNKSDRLIDSSYYSDYSKRRLDSIHKTWFSGGQLKSKAGYNDGKKNGELNTFYRNGIMRRKEVYQMDSMILGVCYDSTGKEIPFFKYEVMPNYPGCKTEITKDGIRCSGEQFLTVFLNERLTYPNKAKEQGIQGKVWLSFVVEKSGEVACEKIERDIGGGCGEEALRVIKLFPDWTPGTMDGEPVRVKYRFPINFTLR